MLNRSSGTVLERGARPLREHIQKRLRGAAPEVRVLLRSGEGLCEAVRSWSPQPETLVVVGGGDGSIVSAIRVMADGAPLGVLPLGTMNLFARDLRIPEDLDEALDVIADGNLREVDLARVNEHIFTTNAHIGVYPRIGQAREARRGQTLLRKVPGLLIEGIRSLIRYPLLDVELQDGDGRKRYCRTRVIAVTNNFHDIVEAGNWPRRSRIDRGELGVHIVEAQSRFRLMFALFSLLDGRWLRHPRIRHLHMQEVIIRTPSGKRRTVLVDGEVMQLPPTLHFRIVPGKLKVVAPPPPAEEEEEKEPAMASALGAKRPRRLEKSPR